MPIVPCAIGWNLRSGALLDECRIWITASIGNAFLNLHIFWNRVKKWTRSSQVRPICASSTTHETIACVSGFLGPMMLRSLDRRISPRKDAFFKLMQQCFRTWKTVLKPHKYCILVVGDGTSEVRQANLPQLISRIATGEVGGYTHVYDQTEAIPNERRVRRGLTGSTSETIVVLRSNRTRAKTAV